MSLVASIGPISLPAGTYQVPLGGGSVAVPVGAQSLEIQLDLTNWTDASRTLSMNLFLDNQDGKGFLAFGSMSLNGAKGQTPKGQPVMMTNLRVVFDHPAVGTEQIKAVATLAGPALLSTVSLIVT
jgi:hypothetical protein